MRRILAAYPNDDLDPWLIAIATALGATTVVKRDGLELEAELIRDATYDLVVTGAQLGGRSGLAVLARARTRRFAVPFIVVTSLRGHLAHVMVSDSSLQTLSSRTLDRENLAMLARSMVRDSNRPHA